MSDESKALVQQRETANLATIEKESEDAARRELAVARGRAKVVADLIRERHLFVTINDKDYVECEGWTTLASYYSMMPEIEWTRSLPDGAGWEARATLVNMQTRELQGSGEAECRYEEEKWRDQDSYALRSMAQTRAVSKVCRLRLSAVMVLAGFAATPAEEIQKEGRETVPCRECGAPTRMFRDGKARGHKLSDGRWHRQPVDQRPAATETQEGGQDVPKPITVPATQPQAPADVVAEGVEPVPTSVQELVKRAGEKGVMYAQVCLIARDVERREIKGPGEIKDIPGVWAKVLAAAKVKP